MAGRVIASARPRLVGLKAACEALGCSRRTFWRRWNAVFSDPRPAAERGRFPRKVFADELAAAVEEGAEAVVLLRMISNRR